PRARLAHRHARRREVLGSALPPLARGAAVRTAPPPQERVARHRTPARSDELVAAPAARSRLLPLPPALHAGRGGGLALAAVRPGRELQPLRRQSRRPAAGRAARLLLFHAHALRLAFTQLIFSRGHGPRT